mmetsp:Transcript_36775/g.80641  ORF Transcript_36775/g.80641 Transcript_36775/m.80641 type:complete len:486 (-) Transcript_36775:51-1508(-)
MVSRSGAIERRNEKTLKKDSSHERVGQNILELDALRRIHGQHLAQEVRKGRTCTWNGAELPCQDLGLICRKGHLAGNHFVQDHAQTPDVDLGAVRFALDLNVADRHGKVDHGDLGQNFTLALVVTSHLVGAIEGAARGVVQKAIAHEVQNVIESHLGHIHATDRLHDPAVLHALLPGLAQGVTLVAFRLDDLDDTSALAAGSWSVAPNAKGPDAVLNVCCRRNLSWIGGVEIVATCENDLGRHVLQRTNAFLSLKGFAFLCPVSCAEVDELDGRPLRRHTVGAEQDIVRLQISMDHPSGVQVRKAIHELTQDAFGLSLRKFALRLNVVRKLTTLDELEDNHLPPRPASHIALNVDGFNKLCDVLVKPDVLLHLDFLLHLSTCLLPVAVELHAPHGDHLHSPSHAGSVLALVNAAVGSGAEDPVFVQLVLAAELIGHRVAGGRKPLPRCKGDAGADKGHRPVSQPPSTWRLALRKDWSHSDQARAD